MSYGIRKAFYQSKVWKNTKQEVWLKQNCLCAICHKPVYVDGITEWLPKEKRTIGIVHHVIHLEESNIYDDNITLNLDNLIGVCKDCHEQLHHTDQVTRKGYIFDNEGNITKLL